MTDEKRIIDGDEIPLPRHSADKPLEQARAEMREIMAGGEQVACPCCGQSAKVYARPIYGSMIAMLRLLARSESGMTYAEANTKTHRAGGGDFAKLRHWGLVEGHSGGKWKVTAKGRSFLRNEVRVPIRVLLYRNQVLGFDTSEMVTCSDLAGRDFELEALLGERTDVEAAE